MLNTILCLFVCTLWLVINSNLMVYHRSAEVLSALVKRGKSICLDFEPNAACARDLNHWVTPPPSSQFCILIDKLIGYSLCWCNLHCCRYKIVYGNFHGWAEFMEKWHQFRMPAAVLMQETCNCKRGIGKCMRIYNSNERQ